MKEPISDKNLFLTPWSLVTLGFDVPRLSSGLRCNEPVHYLKCSILRGALKGLLLTLLTGTLPYLVKKTDS